MGSLFLSLILIITFWEDPLPSVTILRLFQNCSKSLWRPRPLIWTLRILTDLLKDVYGGPPSAKCFFNVCHDSTIIRSFIRRFLSSVKSLIPTRIRRTLLFPHLTWAAPLMGSVWYTPCVEFDTLRTKSLIQSATKAYSVAICQETPSQQIVLHSLAKFFRSSLGGKINLVYVTQT